MVVSLMPCSLPLVTCPAYDVARPSPSPCLQPDPEDLWRVAPAGRTRALWSFRKTRFSSELGRSESWGLGKGRKGPSRELPAYSLPLLGWTLPSLQWKSWTYMGSRAGGSGSPTT